MSEAKKKKYFIRHQGMYWSKDGKGYTFSPFDAGIFNEGEHGIRGNDLKISSRGDYAVEIGQILKDLNYTPEKLEDMKAHLDYLKGFII